MQRAILALLSACVLQAEIPGWVRESATSAHPEYPGKTKAVALFNEERVQVDASGKRISQIRKAIKVLTRDGAAEAAGFISYDSRGSRVREFKAWLIHPSGQTKEFGKRDFTEGTAMASYMMYSSQRYYGMNAKNEVDPGTVFGFEATVEEDSVFSQFLWEFQDDLPHLLSRFQLTVPPGWTATAQAYQGASAKPEVSGSTYTWETRKLSPLDREPGAPRLYSMLPRIAVSMLPPEGTVLQGSGVQKGAGIASFRTWKDVAEWKASLIDPQAEVTAAITAKASELTSGKATEMDKVQELSRFVQQIRYVAISINSSRGGGYTPHKADEVLRMAYGDCKDKANLLRTMLKTIQVESYPVSIFSGDPRFTMEDFPSPHQFNHAILAIRVPDTYEAPAVATYPGIGRVLFFDPTDTNVTFGSIPNHEQNSNVLITAAKVGALVKTPAVQAASNRVERQWTLTLDAEGSASGKLLEISTGPAGFAEKALLARNSEDEYRKMMQTTLGGAMAGAELKSHTTNWDEAKKEFRLEVTFEARAYAKVMAGRLFMVRPMPLGFYGIPNTNKAERDQPLVVKPIHFVEKATWTIPAELKVDELPGSDAGLAPGVIMKSDSKQQGNILEASRQLFLEDAVVPPAGYKQIRDLFMRFHGAAESPFVLVKK